MKFSCRAVALGVALLLAGCASTSPGKSYGQVDAMLSERTGGAIRLSPGKPATAIKERSAAIVKDGLTAETAVEAALLNNPAFKARLEELGIAQAEMVQAGLIENPVVHASWRFANGGGASGTGREIGISMNLIDLLTLPLKKSLASGQLEQAKYRLGKEVLDLVADTKAAFYEADAAGQELALRRQVVESLEAAVTLAKRQREAGNLSRLNLSTELAAYHEATLEQAKAETRVVAARERLALLTGLPSAVGHGGPAEAEALPAEDPALEALESAAVAQRWDLQSARREPSVLKQALRIDRLNFFSSVDVGVDSEKEFDGAFGVGPSVAFSLPLFDRRQASRARLKAQLRRSLSSLSALENEVRLEVRVAHARLRVARKQVETYRDELVPLRRQIAEETLKNYNFMLLGVYRVLEVRRDELAAQSGYIDAVKDYWTERAGLEHAVGASIPKKSDSKGEQP